jgi:hypothetical protein
MHIEYFGAFPFDSPPPLNVVAVRLPALPPDDEWPRDPVELLALATPGLEPPSQLATTAAAPISTTTAAGGRRRGRWRCVTVAAGPMT